MPIPSRMAIHMAKNRARNWLASASPKSTEEKRAPTPVRLMTPTMIPAQAQTAMIWIDMIPARSKALTMLRSPMRKGVNHDTTAAAAVASVPARMIE